MDILCISTTDWDEIWGSRQQVMLQMVAKGHRVLFVERQVGPEHLLRDQNLRRRKFSAWKKDSGPIQLKPNLWRWQPPLMLPGRYYSLKLNQWGQRRLNSRLKQVLHQLNFNSPILWLYPPHSAPLLSHFKASLSVYHCIDRFSGIQSGRKRLVMRAQEDALLRGVDQVFVHAQGLRQLYSPLTQRPIILIPSAADVPHYQSTDKVHPLIQTIPKPRLVVMGTIDDRIDRNLLYQLSCLRPHWHLVLIGQIRSRPQDFSSLLSRQNVHYFGKQPFSQLPAFLNGAGVALIPYILNDMTRSISPLKAYEYLAVGMPIVSVDLPEIHPLQPWIRVIKNQEHKGNIFVEEFARAIEIALDSDSPALRTARRQAARSHSWQARAELMQATIDVLLQEKKDVQTR